MSDDSAGQIIFSNDLGNLKKLMAGRKRKARYLILNRSQKYSGIVDYLAGLESCDEIDLEEETRNLRSDFREHYIDLISKLNQANDSLLWWSLYFTRKECAYTDFPQKIFDCYLIANMTLQSPDYDKVIVADDPLMAKQIEDWAAKLQIQTITALRLGWRIGNRIRRFTPGRMLFTLFTAFQYWVILRVCSRITVAKDKDYVVVGSLIDQRCFTEEDRYNDIYLGELPEFISDSGSSVLVYGGIQNRAFGLLNLIRRKHLRFPVLPWHRFGGLNGILNTSWLTLRFYLSSARPKGNLAIGGVCVDRIIREEICFNIRTGHVFNNLWLYYSAKALAKHVKITGFIMPYENRSWEKMLLKGITDGQNNIHTVGYHHAAVSPAHTNMLLGENEAEVFPLPDKIVMTGEITRSILENTGNYPNQIVEAGCALRKGRHTRRIHRRRDGGKINNVLVALASSGKEYLSTLEFLDQALPPETGLEIGIRPHPEFSLDQALAQLPDLKLRFHRTDGSLDDNFDWADVLVYVSSTVGLDAVSIGLPAVGIDLGEFANYDPAPEDCPLKWSVSKPGQLVEVFWSIETLSGPDYEALQAKASEFGKQYFHPVTDENLMALANLLSINGAP